MKFKNLAQSFLLVFVIQLIFSLQIVNANEIQLNSSVESFVETMDYLVLNSHRGNQGQQVELELILEAIETAKQLEVQIVDLIHPEIIQGKTELLLKLVELINHAYAPQIGYFSGILSKLEQNLSFVTNTLALSKKQADALRRVLPVVRDLRTMSQSSKHSAELVMTEISSRISTGEWRVPQTDSRRDYSAAHSEKAVKEWTLMVYINGDNDLESAAIKDVNQLEMVGSSDQINIIAMVDRIDGFDQSNGNWTDTRVFEIQQDDDPEIINSPVIWSPGELDMAQPDSLIDFFYFGHKNYPARRYFLVIWNHGTGWKSPGSSYNPVRGISYDQTSGGQFNNHDLKSALKRIQEINNGRKIEIIGFDACLMGMVEIAYQVKDYADYMVASQEIEPAAGWPYHDFLPKLKAEPQMSTESLLTILVENYVRSYQGGSQGWGNVTLAAYRLDRVDAVAESLDRLCRYILSNYDQFKLALLAARLDSLKFFDAEYADLYDFLQHLNDNSSDQTLRNLVGKVQNSLTDSVEVNSIKSVQSDKQVSFDRELVITSERSAELYWNINEKELPSKSMLPRGSRIDGNMNFIVTPMERTAQGNYIARLNFSNIRDFQINKLHYMFYYSDEFRFDGHTTLRSGNLSSRVGNSSEQLVIASGTSPALAAAHGISIYLTPFDDFLFGYKNLDFSANVAWDELISYQPPFETRNRILLVAHTGHPVNDLVMLKFYRSAVSSLKRGFDVYLPHIYGEVSDDILERYLDDGLVIWFTSSSVEAMTSFEEANLRRYLDNGGKLLITGDNVEQRSARFKIFSDYFNVNYLGDAKSRDVMGVNPGPGDLKFYLTSSRTGTLGKTPAKLAPFGDAQPIMIFPRENACAGVQVARKVSANREFRLVYLGFAWETIPSESARVQMMRHFIQWLESAEDKSNRLAVFDNI